MAEIFAKVIFDKGFTLKKYKELHNSMPKKPPNNLIPKMSRGPE